MACAILSTSTTFSHEEFYVFNFVSHVLRLVHTWIQSRAISVSRQCQDTIERLSKDNRETNSCLQTRFWNKIAEHWSPI